MSKYPMISVDEGILLVLQNCNVLPIETVSIMDCCSRIAAQEIRAIDPFPAFPASIMDGYAVCGPLKEGIYPLQGRILAGSEGMNQLLPGNVAYITTGAMVPPGANAVVKVEDTEVINNDGIKMVSIKVDIKEGLWIRQIGSDIQTGDVIINKGQIINPVDVGLLATVGVTEIPCFAKPTIGVLSTGDEIVNPWETPKLGSIRDSNRASLITAFRSEGNTCIDLGIVKDVKSELADRLKEASTKCDIVVTSGGVSMGDADYVKPVLESLGTIHFGRLHMKPGKPTTFATINNNGKKVLFFGLPGNPVSCLVTKSLMIDPAVKFMTGLPSESCMHPQIKAKLEDSLTLDPERPEYHRAIITFDNNGVAKARSTGNQRSSRLLSMSLANGLICLPQAKDVLQQGTEVTVLLTGNLMSPTSHCIHPRAASMDSPKITTDTTHKPVNDSKPTKRVMRVGLLTISDRASKGIYADESGPAMARILKEFCNSEDYPLDAKICLTNIVPDEIGIIRNIIMEWVDSNQVDVILTSGGTGFSDRDFTPEAIRPLFHREAPIIAQVLVNEGLKFTPLAAMSRPVAGVRHKTFICTLPGSVKAVKENITALKPLLPRIVELLVLGNCEPPKMENDRAAKC